VTRLKLGKFVAKGLCDGSIGSIGGGKTTPLKCDTYKSAYITFTTKHFTSFSLGAASCSFTINRDDTSTSSTSVTLDTDCPTARSMRFGNDPKEVSRATWTEFSSSYSWILA
jgi:hypothetical protein